MSIIRLRRLQPVEAIEKEYVESRSQGDAVTFAGVADDDEPSRLLSGFPDEQLDEILGCSG
jgi:hypothetical protein